MITTPGPLERLPRPASRQPGLANTDPGAWSTVEAAYQAMSAAPKQRAAIVSLDRVWRSIGYLRMAGTAITVAEVARHIESIGCNGPKEQSIRNDKERTYKLVKLAAAAMAVGAAKPKRVRAGRPDDDLLSRIADPQAAAEVRLIIAERDGFRRRCEALEGSHRRLGALGRITGEMAAAKIETLEGLSALLGATPVQSGPAYDASEGAAVIELVRALEELGFEFDKNSGELYSRNGLRAVKGDLSGVLSKIVAAAFPAVPPIDLPASLSSVLRRAA